VMESIVAEGMRVFEEAVEGAANPLDALNRIASMKSEVFGIAISDTFMRDLKEGYPSIIERLLRTGNEVWMTRMERVILEGQQMGQIRRDLSPHIVVTFLQFVREFVAKQDFQFGSESPQLFGEQFMSVLCHGILTKP
jgi:hypothetical protein